MEKVCYCVNDNSMHYGDKPVVGVIVPPDKLPSRVIFSAPQELKRFQQVEKDLYQGEQNAKPKKRGFPTILKFAAGAIAVAILCPLLKTPVINLFKKVFHK